MKGRKKKIYITLNHLKFFLRFRIKICPYELPFKIIAIIDNNNKKIIMIIFFFFFFPFKSKSLTTKYILKISYKFYRIQFFETGSLFALSFIPSKIANTDLNTMKGLIF